MHRYHPLVTNVADVVHNAKRFWKDLDDKEIGATLQKIIPLVHHWYVFEDEGMLHFVPSKFGGYKKMTGKIYLQYYNLPKTEGGLHGKETENQLKQLSTVLDENDPAGWEYINQLHEWMGHVYGQKLRRGATVSLLKGF